MSSIGLNFVENNESLPANRNFSWSGIFAGTFLYLAIEATFGVLALAIFGLGLEATSMSVGAGIWLVVLTGIAMYFAGRLASRLMGASTRSMGMRAGLVTYGMSIFASILVIGLTLGSSTAEPVSVASLLSITGYWTFVTMIVAMFTSAIGGAQGMVKLQPRSVTGSQSEPRRVA